MNKVILIGRFVRDPEIRYTTNDRCCANFSIAVDRKYKQEGQQDADFPRVIAWEKLQNLLKNISGRE